MFLSEKQINDYQNDGVIIIKDVFKDCLYNSPGAQIVAEATNSKSTQIFHEHIFIKDPGTHKETPWHQDMPYYCVDGNDTGSFWIPLDEVDQKNNLL